MERLSAVQQTWIFKRNCSFTPKQVGLFYIAQGSFALLVALFFYIRGIWIVFPFTIAVLFVLAIALLIYAKHATDFEAIEVKGTELIIRINYGMKQQVYEWNVSWVKLARDLNDKELVSLSYQGVECLIGRFIPITQRKAFLNELREQIRRCAQ